MLWCAASLAAVLVPPGWRPAELLAATVVLAAAGLVFMPRALALAEAAAPCAARGRYLAAYQYAFTAAGVLAPAVVALFSTAVWLPWLVVAGGAGAAIAGFSLLAGRGHVCGGTGFGSRIGRSPAQAGAAPSALTGGRHV